MYILHFLPLTRLSRVLLRSFSSLMKIMLPRLGFFFFLDFLSFTWNNRKSHLSMMMSSWRATIIGLFLKDVTAISSSSSPPLQHHSHPSHWCFHWNEGWRKERKERHCPEICYRPRQKERNRIHTEYWILMWNRTHYVVISNSIMLH